MGEFNPTLSLWSLIESMQAHLEDQGLSTEVVDAAVFVGLRAILLADPRRDPAPAAA